jgi:type II secretory pathway pseudopilin PulG
LTDLNRASTRAINRAMTSGGYFSGVDGRCRRSDEAGFALVETIAAALLLVVVALAVFSSLDTATKTAGANKGRTVASALAEQDQERMRGLAITQLSNLHGQTTVTVGGADYTVDSRAEWVRDSSGTTESCTASGTQSDYVRITSTVTSGLVGTATKPVTMQGIVAVPVGSFGPNQGTLTIKVIDRDGNPVKNLGVTGSGPRTLSDVTNDLGCAVFGYIPIGTYTAQLNTAGWVDDARNQISTKPVTVASGAVVTKTMVYDRAAKIDATFVDSSGAAVNTAGATKLRLTNPAVPTGFGDTDVGANQPGAAVVPPNSSGVPSPLLFPFNSAYVVYAGSCDKANPGLYSQPVATKLLDPAEDWTPQVLLPTIQVKITDGNGGPPVANAPATVKIRGTSPSGCTGDQAVVNATTDAAGVVAVAMPYGTFSVCAKSATKQGWATTDVVSDKAVGKSATVAVATGGTAC